MVRSCLLSSFIELRSAVSEEKSKMSQPIRGQGAILFFQSARKKHKRGWWCWDLASCQVSLNSVQRFQRRNQKCFGQSEAKAAILFFKILLPVKFRLIALSDFREKSKMSKSIKGHGGHLVFPIGPKNVKIVEDVEIFLPVKFRWIPFSGLRGEVENVSANQMPGWPSCFSKKSCFLSSFLEFRLAVSEEKSKNLRRTDGRRAMATAHLSLWILNGPKNWFSVTAALTTECHKGHS